MGLKIGETFKDKCFITLTATGVAQTGLADVTCVVIDESKNRVNGTVAEVGNGWYEVTDFTPDAAGVWHTEWSKTANPENYTFHYPYKEFQVGQGQEGALQTDVTTVLADTNELQTDWVNGGRLDLLVDAIKAKTDNLPADPADDSDIDAAIAAVNADVGDFSVQVNLQSLLAALGIPDVAAKSLYTCLITDRLDHATYGLSAIETLVDDLEGRLTATRAGYLDKLQGHLITRTFFSDSQEEVSLTNVAGDKSMPSVTLPNITGTIVHVYAGFKFRMVENTNTGANKLNAAQDIQVRVDTPGVWADAINFVDDQFSIAASTREGGDCIIGDIDLVGTVTAFNDTYQFQWDEGVADLANLNFNDVQTFLIVSYY